MILQRIGRAVLRQRWSVIAIEMLVVVMGIFLGLQADDWNEARKLRAQEAVYVDKLRDDLAQMRSELVDRLTASNDRMQRMLSALDAMEACDPAPAAEAAMKFTLESYQILPPLDYLDATYSEMVASGAHARLGSQDLKRQLSQTFSVLREHNLALRNFRVSMPVVDAIVWNQVDYSVDADSGRAIARFDLGELCRSRSMRNAVVEMIDIQRDGAGAARAAIESVDRATALLDAYAVAGPG